jgi:histone acetyltransferase (RNA polymerase elongator complex component)
MFSFMAKQAIIPFFIPHAGCSHRCVFCNQEKIAAGNPFCNEVTAIGAALDAVRGCGVFECAFYGGTFGALPQARRRMLLEAVRPYRAAGTVSGIRISTRPDSVTDELADELLAAGVTVVELGVQSLCDEVLESAERGHTAQDVVDAVAVLKAHGFRIGLQLMPGLPGDTYDRSVETMEQSLALVPDFLRLYPTLVIADTTLEILYQRGGYRPLELEEAVSLCKVLLLRAEKAGVPVIRVGIQPTDELERNSAIVAGPYHPAFRQLVEGEMIYDLVLRLMEGVTAHGGITISCHPSRVSDVTGQRRRNILRLLKMGVAVERVVADPLLTRSELVITGKGTVVRGNMLEMLDYDRKACA